MNRILVSGATGFVGRHVIGELVRSGEQVHAVSRSPQSTAGVSWHRADVLDSQAVASVMSSLKPTHLVHLAWFATPGRYLSAPENLDLVKASTDLMTAFVANGGRRIVAAGSCAEYDASFGYCSEASTPIRPATLYASAKHAFSTLLDGFARQAGIEYVWARLFHSYGPHEHPERVVPSVIRSLLQGREAKCTAGDQVRDFLFIEDSARALVSVLRSDVVGPINIASGIPIRLRDLIMTIAERIGRADLVRFGALPKREGDPAVLYADVSRLRDEVKWRPAIDLIAGMDATISWWRTMKEIE